MKTNFFKALLVLLPFTLSLVPAFGQSPNGMSYQAVIRNNSDHLVTNQAVGIRVSILQGSVFGASVFVETHSTSTNANGLLTIEIGGGTPVLGTFSGINWSDGPYFIKTETDTAGGTNYTITGTSQLLSVPYALYAKEAEAISGGIPAETDPVYTAWDKDYYDLINAPTIPTVPTNVTAFTNDAGYLTSFIENDPTWTGATNETGDIGRTGNVGIGTTSPDASSKLEVHSTNSGILIPRLTLVQRNAIVSPATGLIIYNLDCNELQYYTGTEWVGIVSSNTNPSTLALNATDISCSSFRANWDFSVGASHYIFDLATDPSFANIVSGYYNLNVGNVNTISVTGITPGTNYFYRVKSVISECLSGTSNIKMATTLPDILDAPIAFIATDIQNETFIASWSSVQYAEHYYFDLATDPLFGMMVPQYDDYETTTDTTLLVENLTPGTTYFFRVRAGHTCGLSANSNTIEATTTNIILSLWYRDIDNDTWGNNADTQWAETCPPGYIFRGGDCDDHDQNIHPDAADVCDGIDNDCDFETDEEGCPSYPNSTVTCNGPGGCVYTPMFPYDDCDGNLILNGFETNLWDDEMNCGSCHYECPGPLTGNGFPYCFEGDCYIQCDPGYHLVGVECVPD